ncbi:MAG TPA: DUF3341 domain-containing protein [Oxalicibacterium sp.]|nr:DUF3341 domain-containing protein [Oxalicibacterium sp.]
MSCPLYGLLAEFATADDLLAAVRRARDAGFVVEAYTPFAVDGLPEAIGFPRNRVPFVTLIGGIVGGAGGYFLQWYSAVVDYPLNIGGRPLHSWPSFIPVTFEMTILGAALAAVFGMLMMNGLPRLRHPLFDVPDFDLVSRNRFFLCLRANRTFDRDKADALMRELPAIRQCEVAA